MRELTKPEKMTRPRIVHHLLCALRTVSVPFEHFGTDYIGNVRYATDEGLGPIHTTGTVHITTNPYEPLGTLIVTMAEHADVLVSLMDALLLRENHAFNCNDKEGIDLYSRAYFVVLHACNELKDAPLIGVRVEALL